MEFEAALAQEALGVFGRTGLTPSQLADGLTEALIAADEERSLRLGAEKAEKSLFAGLTDCQTTRESWVSAYVRVRDALRVLADAADVVGVKYFDTDTMDPEVEAMQKATQAARSVMEN